MIATSMHTAPRVPAGSNSLAARAAQGLADGVEPTRRGILGALAGVPVAAAFGTIALSPLKASPRAWEAAIANWKRAEAIHDQACTRTDAAYARYYEGQKALPKQPNGMLIRAGDTLEQASARMKAEVAKAKQADAECRLASGIDAAETAQDIACDADCDARAALFQMPAPDLRAVIFKMEIEGSTNEHEWILADLRHLVAKEG